MVVGVDCVAKGEMCRVTIVWEGVQMDFKGVEDAKKVEGIVYWLCIGH